MDKSFGEYHRRLSREKPSEPLYPYKPVRALPPNTLTNSDGSPYSAGHDEKTLGQIAYEAFVESPYYRHLQAKGYTTSPRWIDLMPIEQQAWGEVAQAVKNSETTSQ